MGVSLSRNELEVKGNREGGRGKKWRGGRRLCCLPVEEETGVLWETGGVGRVVGGGEEGWRRKEDGFR